MATATLNQDLDPPGLLDRVDRWTAQWGDRFNPILVKETRQALKSRQFVITFSVLLVAALGWTIVGSLSMMPRIYDSPSATRMLIGYYVVLAIPMLMVVPLAAYRSLEGEIDDGTLELLSITILSPWQIVLGKLASAMLQMLLYFIALFPCVAYAYTLRGVDLPTIGLMIAILVVAGILLTIAALFFAPLARTRTGRISTLLAVMALLLGAEWGLGFLVISMLSMGNPLTADELFYAIVATIAVACTLGHLLMASTAAQLTPESENRSTHIRVSMLVLTSIWLGLIGLAIQMLRTGNEIGFIVGVVLGFLLAVLWTLVSSLLSAESAVMTPRIRRELPSSLAARATLTWLTPGPLTGLVFSTLCITLTTAAAWAFLQYGKGVSEWRVRETEYETLQRICITYSTYLIGYLVAVYWLVRLVRLRNHPRVEIGFAALIVVAVFAVLLPYSVGLHLNDYRPYSYSLWQITNFAWTLAEVSEYNGHLRVVALVGFLVVAAFLATVLTEPQLVFARRIATPKRVKQALAEAKAGS